MANPKFRFNTHALSQNLQKEILSSPIRAKRAMDAVGGYLRGEIQERTPQDDGFLTGEVNNVTVAYRKSYASVLNVPANGQSSKYALKMHEGVYNLGEKSLDKQRKTGKTVGRKFITRGLEENQDTIKNIINEEMKI